jgi:hypothetical protein
VLGALVFHSDYDLNEQTPAGGQGQEARTRRIRKTVPVKGRMQTDAPKPMDLMAPAEVVFPVGERGVYGPDWKQAVATRSATSLGQTDVDPRDVALKEALETRHPRLRNVRLPQTLGKRSGVLGR